MEWVFWIFLGLIIYCYVGYPLCLKLVAGIINRSVDKQEIFPSVSIVLSVYNEEDVIESKIQNFLSLDYPKEKIEILIGSDGSTDNTNAIVRSFASEGVKLIERKERRGKMVTLNDLVNQAANEIILFTDARQRFEIRAIKELVANFHDPHVGCVSGELVFSEEEGGTAKGINLYWSYEKFMRILESRIHSMLGATGAIYAIRRELYPQVPEKIILDDVYVPLTIVKKGFRAILDPEAKAFDKVANSPKEEHRRKARTLAGNYQIFFTMGEMFNPSKSPVALQLFSHKFLRVMGPFLMIGVYVANIGLLDKEFYKLIFLFQNIFYAMAIVGALARYQKYGILKIVSRLCFAPYVFCLLNFSALAGFVRFFLLKQEITWEKAREKKI